MFQLLIQFENGVWVARLANTDVVYTFVGATADDQLQVIRGMADLMSEGRINVYNDLFVNPPAQPIDDILFANSSSISVDAAGGAVGGAWSTENATILTDIEEAGEVLLGLL
jgi:hypothetical protein